MAMTASPKVRSVDESHALSHAGKSLQNQAFLLETGSRLPFFNETLAAPGTLAAYQTLSGAGEFACCRPNL
jgi:hypothetical protein